MDSSEQVPGAGADLRKRQRKNLEGTVSLGEAAAMLGVEPPVARRMCDAYERSEGREGLAFVWDRVRGRLTVNVKGRRLRGWRRPIRAEVLAMKAAREQAAAGIEPRVEPGHRCPYCGRTGEG